MIGKKEKKSRKGEKRKPKKAKGDDESIKKMKKEMEEMRRTIVKLQANSSTAKNQEEEKAYALGFDPNEYLALGFIESTNWIAEKLAVRLRARMNEHPDKWLVLKKFNPPEVKSLVTCVAYNRGDTCRLDKWHTVLKKTASNPENDIRQRLNRMEEELRVHACTLCWKGIGVLSMHQVMDCPWILEKNWI